MLKTMKMMSKKMMNMMKMIKSMVNEKDDYYCIYLSKLSNRFFLESVKAMP